MIEMSKIRIRVHIKLYLLLLRLSDYRSVIILYTIVIIRVYIISCKLNSQIAGIITELHII